MNKLNQFFNNLLSSTETIETIGDRWLKAEFIFPACGLMIAVLVVVGK